MQRQSWISGSRALVWELGASSSHLVGGWYHLRNRRRARARWPCHQWRPFPARWPPPFREGCQLQRQIGQNNAWTDLPRQNDSSSACIHCAIPGGAQQEFEGALGQELASPLAPPASEHGRSGCTSHQEQQGFLTPHCWGVCDLWLQRWAACQLRHPGRWGCWRVAALDGLTWCGGVPVEGEHPQVW